MEKLNYISNVSIFKNSLKEEENTNCFKLLRLFLTNYNFNILKINKSFKSINDYYHIQKIYNNLQNKENFYKLFELNWTKAKNLHIMKNVLLDLSDNKEEKEKINSTTKKDKIYQLIFDILSELNDKKTT